MERGRKWCKETEIDRVMEERGSELEREIVMEEGEREPDIGVINL